eukprot:ANDGO_03427.mRNA.1 hypothetical protein
MPLENSGAFRLFTTGICCVGLAYGVLLADYGDKEHVFSPFRRWVSARKRELSEAVTRHNQSASAIGKVGKDA